MRNRSSQRTYQVTHLLEQTRRSLTDWRRKRKRGKRIPEAVWEMAVKSAVECGLSKAASVLGLDYYMLRRRVAAVSEHSTQCGDQASPTFVELPRAVHAGVTECMIEFEGKHGGKMRIHLKGSEALDVASLGREFWSAES